MINKRQIRYFAPPDEKDPEFFCNTTTSKGSFMHTAMRNADVSPETGRQRVQLEFTPEAIERLRQIKALANASTNAEVVKNALRVYEWFLNQRNNHYKLQLVKDDQVKEVEIVL